ncbi:MAG: MG2 domain-containing protein, partial [Thermoplasmatales archaeon]|nr:MG2 domain-containing protein [Thermoplasmatales archaeon]
NITSSTDITLTATDLPAHNAGVKKVWYYVNDVGNYSETVGATVTFDLTGYPEGMHTIYYGAEDNLSNNASAASHIVWVDDTAPTSTVDAISPYWYNTQPLTINVTASDNPAHNAGIYNVSLYYYYSSNNVSWGSAQQFGSTLTAEPWSWSFNFLDGNGYYRFYSIAVDNLGNTETFTGNDTMCGYDATPPVITYANADPTTNVSTTRPTNITANATDATSGFPATPWNVTVYNATSLTVVAYLTPTITASNGYRNMSASWNAIWGVGALAGVAVPDGDYIIRMTVFDQAGNSNTTDRTVTVYKAAGIVTLIRITDWSGNPVSQVVIGQNYLWEITFYNLENTVLYHPMLICQIKNVEGEVVYLGIAKPTTKLNPGDSCTGGSSFLISSSSLPGTYTVEGQVWNGWISDEGANWTQYAKKVTMTIPVVASKEIGSGAPKVTYNISVTTDKAGYLPGENVTISGYLTTGGAGVPGVDVGIEVRDPDNNAILTDTLTTNASGYYSIILVLLNDAKNGTYTVLVVYSGATDNTTFYVIDNLPPAPNPTTMDPEPAYTQGLFNYVSCGPVTDDNLPVYYEFQCAVDTSFTNAVNTTWLTTNYTTFTKAQLETLTATVDGQTFYYRVRTKDNVGNIGSWSAPVNSTQDASPPPQPTITPELVYTQGINNTINCSIVYDGGVGGVQYQFRRSNESTFPVAYTVEGSWSDVPGYTFTSLTDGVKYYYQVRVRDALGNTVSWATVTDYTWSTQDDTAPETILSIAEEVHPDGGASGCNVTSSTVFTLSATDATSGVSFTWYTIDTDYYVGISFTLAGYAEGSHTITWGSRDTVGNNETGNSIVVWVDDTAPTTVLGIVEEVHPDAGASGCNITSSTDITLTATDLPAHNAG